MKKQTAIVIASVEQLKSIWILDIPNGALVQVYDIDKRECDLGKLSTIKYKYKEKWCDYQIPTKWLAI